MFYREINHRQPRFDVNILHEKNTPNHDRQILGVVTSIDVPPDRGSIDYVIHIGNGAMRHDDLRDRAMPQLERDDKWLEHIQTPMGNRLPYLAFSIGETIYYTSIPPRENAKLDSQYRRDRNDWVERWGNHGKIVEIGARGLALVTLNYYDLAAECATGGGVLYVPDRSQLDSVSDEKLVRHSAKYLFERRER